jgi:hypothetical protein
MLQRLESTVAFTPVPLLQTLLQKIESCRVIQNERAEQFNGYTNTGAYTTGIDNLGCYLQHGRVRWWKSRS